MFYFILLFTISNITIIEHVSTPVPTVDNIHIQKYTNVCSLIHHSFIHSAIHVPYCVQAETEEEEPVELTEEEEAIKASLENSDTLAPEFLDHIVPQWWNKEPFKLVLLDQMLGCFLAVFGLFWGVGLSVDSHSLLCFIC